MAPSGKPNPRDGLPPTARQIYALAAALCAFTDQEWPATRAEASDLIERIRIDIGHPAPSLEDMPVPSTRRRQRRRRGDPASWGRIALAKETLTALSGQLDDALARQSPNLVLGKASAGTLDRPEEPG